MLCSGAAREVTGLRGAEASVVSRSQQAVELLGWPKCWASSCGSRWEEEVGVNEGWVRRWPFKLEEQTRRVSADLQPSLGVCLTRSPL